MKTPQKQSVSRFTIIFVFLLFSQNLFAPPYLSANNPMLLKNTVTVVRGPYLQSGTPNSMVVRWRTSEATESVINFGTDLDNLNLSEEDLTLKTEHEMTITGLSQGTVYFYEIGNEGNTLVPKADDLYFKTSPPNGQSVPVNIWVLGDCGTGNDNARDVRDAFYTFNGDAHIDLMLLLGDNAYSDGTDAEYQDGIFENMYEERLKNTVLWSTIGNHDGHSSDSDSQTGPYFDIFTFPTNAEAGGTASGTEAYYSFYYSNIHFIILDSYETDRDVDAPMYAWAENDIQNSTADWVIAFWHHPTYSKGSHDTDDDCSQCTDMRENFLPMLESNGVDLVMSGHSHSYERSYLINGHYGESSTFDPDIHIVQPTGGGSGQEDGEGAYEKDPEDTEGAVYIVAGSSGKTSSGTFDHPAHYFGEKELGSVSITIDGNELNAKFIRETDDIDDYFTFLKLDALPIELLTFNVEQLDEKVRLAWQTESETSNLGFEIYRSINADPDRFGWKKIGWLDGRGTTSEKQTYFFDDAQPLKGTNYYRLKQLDIDGKFNFSEIISVDYYDKNPEIQIYPNPAQDKLFVKTSKVNFVGEIIVFDISGNALIEVKFQNNSIDISNLQNGIYHFKIKIDNTVFQERLVVLR